MSCGIRLYRNKPVVLKRAAGYRSVLRARRTRRRAIYSDWARGSTSAHPSRGQAAAGLRCRSFKGLALYEVAGPTAAQRRFCGQAAEEAGQASENHNLQEVMRLDFNHVQLKRKNGAVSRAKQQRLSDSIASSFIHSFISRWHHLQSTRPKLGDRCIRRQHAQHCNKLTTFH